MRYITNHTWVKEPFKVQYGPVMSMDRGPGFNDVLLGSMLQLASKNLPLGEFQWEHPKLQAIKAPLPFLTSQQSKAGFSSLTSTQTRKIEHRNKHKNPAVFY